MHARSKQKSPTWGAVSSGIYDESIHCSTYRQAAHDQCLVNYSARSARWRTYADVDRSFSSADAAVEAPLLEQSL